jgi:hypothetical protein
MPRALDAGARGVPEFAADAASFTGSVGDCALTPSHVSSSSHKNTLTFPDQYSEEKIK